VDDQTLFADSLKAVIGFRAPDWDVIGVAKDGAAAIEAARAERPDLVLMDIRMPGMDGVKATRAIHAELPDTKIVVLTSFDDDEYVYDALRDGAAGYILKDIPVNELLSSLRAVMDGSFLVSPTVASKLVRRNVSPPLRAEAPDGRSANSAPPRLGELGKREREILSLIARGLENAEIASELFISEQTVKNYVYGIYVKLGEHNRIRVADIARRWLGGDPESREILRRGEN
jgi:DNA-binding NarL/FixJ family response regulator